MYYGATFLYTDVHDGQKIIDDVSKNKTFFIVLTQ